MKVLVVLVSMIFMAGCLQTRETMEDGGPERATLREQMKALQARTAQQDLRIDSVLTEVRSLNGKIEQSNGSSSSPSNVEVEQLRARLKIYEEALQKMDQEIQSLKRGRQSSAAPQEAVPTEDLAKGDHYFSKKSWSEAIRAYESYRQKNPSGKNYPKATLRIALSFQSMGMNKEAKAFFQEVADQFPSSEEARTASARLSQL